MTSAPVGSPTPRQRAWVALAAELTPAKSLQRLDAATARVVSTVSIVATLLTGLGLVAAGLANLSGAARALAIVSVGLAVLAVLLALTAQILTITRGLNTNNLAEVEHWYRRRFEFRAPLTRAATILLAAAAFAAGAAAIVTLLGGPDPPTFAVTRTTTPVAAPAATSKLTVEISFRGLDTDQIASATVTVDGTIVAAAAFGPTPEGTATRTLTVEQVPATAVVLVDARGGTAACTATLPPGRAAQLRCSPA